MIDLLNLSYRDLIRLGIDFKDLDDAKLFITHISERTEALVAAALTKKLRDEGCSEGNIKATVRFMLDRREGHSFPPIHPEIVNRVRADLLWDILIHRDELGEVYVNHNVERSDVLLCDVGLPAPILKLLNETGIETIGDALHPEVFERFEAKYPKAVYDVKAAVLSFLFPSVPAWSQSSDIPKGILPFFRQIRRRPIGEILDALGEYILTKAQEYSRGECTRDEFTALTCSKFLADAILQDECEVTVRAVPGREAELRELYRDWKKTGKITSKLLLAELLFGAEDIEYAADLFFTLLDRLLIPIELYFTLSYFGDPGPSGYPNTIRALHPASSYYILKERCTDADQLLKDPDPLGKTYTFHFTEGTSAVVTIDYKEIDRFRGTGVIEGYMAEKGEIEIRTRLGVDFCFNYKEFSEAEMALVAADHPLLHPKWARYNEAIRSRAEAVRKSYDELLEAYLEKNLA